MFFTRKFRCQQCKVFTGNLSVDEFGNCKTLSNTSSVTYIVPTGIAADWSAFLSHLPSGVSSQSCSTNCVGSWGACSGGIQTYTITTPASGSGTACPYAHGATQSCSSTNCVGSWSTCRNGSQTYTITTPASNGGTACPYTDGATQSCVYDVNCVGSWGTCQGSGTQTYLITTPKSGNGLDCPAASGDVRACAVNGVCGSANGTTVSSAPSNNLCTAGTASSVSGSGPWSWTCDGLNSGTSSNCIANKATSCPCGRCDSIRHTNLCSGSTGLSSPYYEQICTSGGWSAKEVVGVCSCYVSGPRCVFY